MPAEINVEGHKVNLGDEFEVGKGAVGLSELFGIFRQSLSQTSFGQAVETVLVKLESGDTIALAALGVTIAMGIYVAYSIFASDGASGSGSTSADDEKKAKEEEDNKPKPRDFTIEQLREFDGNEAKCKSIYISLNNDVFDVTAAKDFYGAGSGYNCFAGREASRAMAKLSFDEAELSSTRLDDLNPFERESLDGWYSKFRDYKCYPIVGRTSVPPAARDFTREELAKHKKCSEIPAGRVDAPILVGIKGKVIDVSYGGKEMYGHDGPYHIFAGIDASRALAKMSFKPEDLSSNDLSDLTEEQKKTLDDWETKLINVRKYPVVGKLVE